MELYNFYKCLLILIHVVLVFAISQQEAYTSTFDNGQRNTSQHGKILDTELYTLKESEEHINQFAYNTLQLFVPKNIKMNDINDYHEIVLPAYSNTNIQLTNMSQYGKNVGFALIQVNAYEFNVTLSYTKTIIEGKHLTGLNLGLVLYEDGNLYAINTNPHENVWISVVLMLYNQTAPLPGGCNMEFPVEVSPILNLTLKESTIEVDTPPGSLARQYNTSDSKCGKIPLIYESYYLSMPSYDFSQKTYFTYIRNLISYANAKTAGRLNNLTMIMPGIKRIYDRQIGRGMVFVTVVIDPGHNGFSAYVPVHSYACQPFVNIGGCYEFNVPVRIVGLILTIIMFAEIFVGFFPLPVKGFVCGAIIGLIGAIKLAKVFSWLATDAELTAILIIGAFLCGILFTVLSIYCPIASIIICNFVVGYMLCSVIFYGIYGSLFITPNVPSIILLSGIGVGWIFSSIRICLMANGFLFGSAVLFYSINIIFSARLHYSLRNLYYGFYDDNYQIVLSDSTLDTNEIMALTSYIIVLSICIYLRMRCRLREQQPVPSGFWVSCGNRGSRTSLAMLADDAFLYDHPTITRWTSGDDDVFESPRSNARFLDRLRNFGRERYPNRGH